MNKHLILRPITQKEWDEYEWFEVTSYSDLAQEVRVWIRGAKKTQPPQDGYIYYEALTIMDTEQNWHRCMTPDEEAYAADS